MQTALNAERPGHLPGEGAGAGGIPEDFPEATMPGLPLKRWAPQKGKGMGKREKSRGWNSTCKSREVQESR